MTLRTASLQAPEQQVVTEAERLAITAKHEDDMRITFEEHEETKVPSYTFGRMKETEINGVTLEEGNPISGWRSNFGNADIDCTNLPLIFEFECRQWIH